MSGTRHTPRTCVFCGGTPVHQEHVFPRWLGRLFTDEVVEFESTVALAGEPAHKRPWRGRPFGTTVGGPCKTCNSGWMSDLENRTAGVLKPMVGNHDQRLSPVEQHLVATWATKTMLMLRLVVSAGDEELSEDTYRWVYEKQAPPPAERVWIASYKGEGQWPAAFNYWGVAIARPGEEPREPNAHCASFAVGHLAVGLAGHSIRDALPIPVPRLPADARSAIWPAYGEEVIFPPVAQLAGDEELRTLALPREWSTE